MTVAVCVEAGLDGPSSGSELDGVYDPYESGETNEVPTSGLQTSWSRQASSSLARPALLPIPPKNFRGTQCPVRQVRQSKWNLSETPHALRVLSRRCRWSARGQ